MTGKSAEACCSHSHGGQQPPARATVAGAGLPTFRIATMDCAVDEGEIRNALERVPGINSLRFQLGNRTLGIDVPDGTLEAALTAIGSAGSDSN